MLKQAQIRQSVRVFRTHAALTEWRRGRVSFRRYCRRIPPKHSSLVFPLETDGCVERVRTADGVPVMLENNIYVYEDNAYLSTAPLSSQSILSSCVTGRAVRPRLRTRAHSRSRARRPRSLGCWQFPLANPCFIWKPSFSMSSGGRLSSVVSGSLGLATFLTSRTLRMETPG